MHSAVGDSRGGCEPNPNSQLCRHIVETNAIVSRECIQPVLGDHADHLTVESFNEQLISLMQELEKRIERLEHQLGYEHMLQDK